MNLMDFDLYCRPDRVKKGRIGYEVIELKKASIVWTAKVSPGLYRIQVKLSGEMGIHIESHSCNCDNKRYTHCCEHELAVMFSLRKEFQVTPALTNTVWKISAYDKELRSEVKSMLDDYGNLPLNSIKRYKKICTGMMNEIPAALDAQEYNKAVELVFGAYKALHRMFKYIESYSPHEAMVWEGVQENMPWLEKVASSNLPEEVREAFLNDLYIDSIKRYVDWPDELETNPLHILLAASDTKERKERFVQFLDTLLKIAKADREKSMWPHYVKDLQQYKAKAEDSFS